MARATKSTGVLQKTIDHFEAIPWCAEHLSDPAFRLYNMSRTVTQPGDGHTLTGRTWNTDDTIKELLSMYRAPSISPSQSGEVRRFYTFGKGMNAHPGLLHGGVIATVLDSTMGNIVGQQMPEQLPTFTVALNITYKKPVTTPGTILARSWITKAEGRKIWVSGTIESGTGEVHATAEGMWLRANPKI